jgi:hypothetical protein
MPDDTLTVVANAVMQQVRDAGGANAKGDLLASLPVYLDAAEVCLLQTQLNRQSVIHVELQHRPGERRVGVRVAAPLRRGGTGWRP